VRGFVPIAVAIADFVTNDGAGDVAGDIVAIAFDVSGVAG